MYPAKPGLLIGFHGCDESIRNEIINDKKSFKPSENKYDWLGSGMYFWENNQQRALDFAKEQIKSPDLYHSKIIKPAVLGAVIDLGFCLDLLDAEFLSLVKESYTTLKETFENVGIDMPANKKGRDTSDLLIRDLDCAVIKNVHFLRSENDLKPFDSVRGVFVEGNHLYPNAGFNEKNHIRMIATVCRSHSPLSASAFSPIHPYSSGIPLATLPRNSRSTCIHSYRCTLRHRVAIRLRSVRSGCAFPYRKIH